MHNSTSAPNNTIYAIIKIIQSKMHPQSGAVIHHQDQSITLVNLSTRNTKNKILENDNP